MWRRLSTGSDLHLIRLSLYKWLDASELEKISVPFDSVGSTNNRTLGRFKTDVTVLDRRIDFCIYLRNFWRSHDLLDLTIISYDLIIGGELSDHAEVKLKKKQLTLTKIDETSDGQRNENQLEIEFVNLERSIENRWKREKEKTEVLASSMWQIQN